MAELDGPPPAFLPASVLIGDPRDAHWLLLGLRQLEKELRRNAVTADPRIERLYRALASLAAPTAQRSATVSNGQKGHFVMMDVMATAAHIGCSPQNVRRACATKSLPAKKVGRAWRIHPLDAARYKEEHQ
jgi:hypothetical protein